ncbi:MAG: hypothetical protein HQK51_21000 [Oligoflexia bacterium]|nr:hypothetical protein [Oligoflexia bacterium]
MLKFKLYFIIFSFIFLIQNFSTSQIALAQDEYKETGAIKHKSSKNISLNDSLATDESLEEYYKRSELNFRRIGIPTTFGHRVKEVFKNYSDPISFQKGISIDEIKELYRMKFSSDDIVNLKNAFKNEIDYKKLVEMKRSLKNWDKDIYELISLRSLITKEKINLEEAILLLDKGFDLQSVKGFFYILDSFANLQLMKEINDKGLDLIKSAFFIKMFSNNNKEKMIENIQHLIKFKEKNISLDEITKIKDLFGSEIN